MGSADPPAKSKIILTYAWWHLWHLRKRRNTASSTCG